MSEEKDGFTFVDKRRTAVEDTTDEDPFVEEVAESAPASEADVSQTDTSTSSGSSNVAEPPATHDILLYCTQLLAADAWQKMGLLADPRTGEAKQDLIQAKIGIDAVGDLINRLESTPESAVPPGVRRDLRTLLNDLRLNYVGQHDRATKTIVTE